MFGPKFANKILVRKPCIAAREVQTLKINNVDVSVPGLAHTSRFLCSALDVTCNTYTLNTQHVLRILALVHSVGQSLRLKYSLAGDSLRYVHGDVLHAPYTGSVAIYRDDAKRWRDGLQAAMQGSSFILNHANITKGAIFEILYSRISPLKVIFWAIVPQANFPLAALDMKFPESPWNFSCISAESSYYTPLVAVCSKCAACQSRKNNIVREGVMKNAASQTCLDIIKNGTISNLACHYEVCTKLFYIYCTCLLLT
jgi:hypothetical protein